MKSEWTRVYEKELSRRRRISRENPGVFTRLHSANPKGLLSQDKCSSHIWVPASHLMIHDNAGKTYQIKHLDRRAFREAYAYREGNEIVVPQMCWTCDCYRLFRFEHTTAEHRKKQFGANRPRKRKGRTPQQEIVSVIDDAFLGG